MSVIVIVLVVIVAVVLLLVLEFRAKLVCPIRKLLCKYVRFSTVMVIRPPPSVLFCLDCHSTFGKYVFLFYDYSFVLS